MKNWERTADATLWKLEADFNTARWGEQRVKEAINLVKEEIKNAQDTGRQIRANTGNTLADTIIKKHEGTIRSMAAKYAEETGTAPHYARDIGQAVNSAIGAAQRLRGR